MRPASRGLATALLALASAATPAVLAAQIVIDTRPFTPFQAAGYTLGALDDGLSRLGQSFVVPDVLPGNAPLVLQSFSLYLFGGSSSTRSRWAAASATRCACDRA